MYHTLSDGQKIWYEYYQKNLQFKTIVFLNGLAQATPSWQPFVKALDNEHNILAVDLVFQGQSDKEGESRSLEQHADDVNNLLESLGLYQVIPIGISYGSAVAQRLAVRHSERIKKMVLMSTFARKTVMFEQISYSWEQALKTGGFPLLLDVMMPAVLGRFYMENPETPLDTWKESRNKLVDNQAAMLKLMQATKAAADYREELKKLRMPVLIIQGESDILTTPAMAREVAQSIPNSELVILKQKGHTLNAEAINECIELIKRFI
jgi:3-oxoadipate enol-lactonase